MENNHREKIKDSILEFKKRKIDYIDLMNNLYDNIKALDNLDQSVENALINLSGEMETIYYMQAPEYHYKYMIDEISKFEPYIDKI